MTGVRLLICAFTARLVYGSSSVVPQPLPPRSYAHLEVSGVEPSAPLNSSPHASTKPVEGGIGGGAMTPPPPQLRGNAAREQTKSTGKDLRLRKIQCALERAFFVVDLFLQLKNRVKHRFRPRRAARH